MSRTSASAGSPAAADHPVNHSSRRHESNNASSSAAGADDALGLLLGEIEAVLPRASGKAVQHAKGRLERLLEQSRSMIRHASSAPEACGPSQPSTLRPLPDGLSIGEYCQAMGLRAGTRHPFKAILIGRRSMKPEFLVKYVADIDGRTMPLLLPEVRNTYIDAGDVSPWQPASAGMRTPSSAKTRGQQASRAEVEAGASSLKRKRGASKAGKHVRFDDRVIEHPCAPCHTNPGRAPSARRQRDRQSRKGLALARRLARCCHRLVHLAASPRQAWRSARPAMRARCPAGALHPARPLPGWHG